MLLLCSLFASVLVLSATTASASADPLPEPTISDFPCPIYVEPAASGLIGAPIPIPIPIPEPCPPPFPPEPCVAFTSSAVAPGVIQTSLPYPEPCPPVPCVAFGDPTLVVSPCPPPVTQGELQVTPGSVSLGEPFSLRATDCPGPFPLGADYTVTFTIDYLPPPQLPGAPSPGEYSVTLNSTNLGSETFVATWSLPVDAPTLGGAYLVGAKCIGNELGGEFTFFQYDSTVLIVTDNVEPVLTATPTTVQAGDSIFVTATGCPTPPYLGADYRVQYTLSLIGSASSISVGGPNSFGEHEALIPTPQNGPGGQYEISAECIGNELGGNFVAFSYDPVTITVQGAPAVLCDGRPVTVFLALGDRPTNGDDVILGTNGPDLIRARGGNDVVCGLDGNDVIFGGAGNDVLRGGRDYDTLFGGNGSDIIRGGFGSDTMNGGAGPDVLYGSAGADTLRGSSGDDWLAGGSGPDGLFGGGGNDECRRDRSDRVRGCDSWLSFI